MATDATNGSSNRPLKTTAELVALVKEELDADGERQAKVSAASAGELLRESQTGVTLDLSRSNIAELPEEVLLLIKDRVERLALSHNPHIVLSNAIGQCDRLRYLNLRWNKLARFPEAVLNLPKLEILDVSKNLIDSIPEDIRKMVNLKFLTIARNRITRLPLALGEMNLVKLKFDENPIEFPPPDVLKASVDRTASLPESEKDKDMCFQVKRFMKTAALKELREKLKTNSEEELSESNIETPRPLRRGATVGRFPVRPSISGMDAFEPKSDTSTDAPPPIPARSHARGVSTKASNPPNTPRRPGITPLLTGGKDINRSRSETVATSANLRLRRKGFVTEKIDPESTAIDDSLYTATRNSNASTITPGHSRAPSAVSAYGRLVATTNGADSSSEAASPVETGAESRMTFPRHPSTIVKNKLPPGSVVNGVRAVNRTVSMLHNFKQPVGDLVKQLKPTSPTRMALERHLLVTSQKVEELDRLVRDVPNFLDRGTDMRSAPVMSSTRTALSVISSCGLLVRELKRTRPRNVDPFHLRGVLVAAHHVSIEARNICHMLGYKTANGAVKHVAGSQQTLSHHAVTSSSIKLKTGRRRGPTVLPSNSSFTNLRGAVPPVALNTGNSRTNTMTSLSGTTLHSMDGVTANSNYPSRSNTMRSYIHEPEESNDFLYAKIKTLCKRADSILPHVRNDLDERKTDAESNIHSRSLNHYAQAVSKCDMVMTRTEKVHALLKPLKPYDLARAQAEIGNALTDLLIDWTRFADAIKECVRLRNDIGTIRSDLKPIHHAIQDMRNAIQDSALFGGPGFGLAIAGSDGSRSTASFVLSPYYHNAGSQASGPNTPLPATPAGAALGPAVQATVASTPGGNFVPSEYFNLPVPRRTRSTHERHHDRVDTVMQPPVLPSLPGSVRR